MTRATLKKKIDQLGRLREEQTALGAAERTLSEEVRDGLQAAKLTGLEAAKFGAVLAETRSLRIDPKKFRRKVGEKIFLASCRVDVKAARVHLDDAGLQRVASYDPRTSLRISRRPTAGKGRKRG